MISITTAQLIIRTPELSDALGITHAINDWEVVRWLSRVPHPYLERDATEFIERCKISLSEGSSFRFVILFKNKIVGGIGLEQQSQTLFELGYWITRQHWNKGFATEAVFAVTNFAHDSLANSQITASCHENNWRSEKVLLRTNFSRTGTALRFSKVLDTKVSVIQFLWVPPVTDCSI